MFTSQPYSLNQKENVFGSVPEGKPKGTFKSFLKEWAQLPENKMFRPSPFDASLNPKNKVPTKLITLPLSIPRLFKPTREIIIQAVYTMLVTKNEAALIALSKEVVINLSTSYLHPNHSRRFESLLTICVELDMKKFVDFALMSLGDNVKKIHPRLVHHAISAEMVVILHRNKIDVNTLNTSGNICLSKFAMAGILDSVKLIVENCNPEIDITIAHMVKEMIKNSGHYSDENDHKLKIILTYLMLKKGKIENIKDFLLHEYRKLSRDFGQIVIDSKKIHHYLNVHTLWLLEKNNHSAIKKQHILDQLWQVCQNVEVELDKTIRNPNFVSGNPEFKHVSAIS